MSVAGPTTRQAVLERDRWQCQMPVCLCPDGRDIDPDASADTNWCASLDHIKQRVHGGQSEIDNLRAAHRVCNAAGSEGWGSALSKTSKRRKRRKLARERQRMALELFESASAAEKVADLAPRPGIFSSE